jgi:hypothetical protein
MLFGYSLENLSKGIIFCRDPRLVTSSRLQRLDEGGHGLVYLFDKARIELTDKEREVLDRTTRMTVWRGRYPVPLRFDTAGPQDPMLGYVAVSGIWPEHEYNELCALYDRAKAELVDTMQTHTPLPENYDFGEP